MQSINIGKIVDIKPVTIDPGSNKIIEYWIGIETTKGIVRGDVMDTSLLGDKLGDFEKYINHKVEFEIEFTPTNNQLSKINEIKKDIILREKEYPEVYGKIIGEKTETLNNDKFKLGNPDFIVDCGIKLIMGPYPNYSINDFIHGIGFFYIKLINIE